ncbi:hypothetical protein [Promicromonospora sp. MEB111]|uniref:hypothetical protein n=1 Tax=Promicromonospora sp. MEB111 TaxID=3040301 RepID=UPI0025517BC6|nr:hypothetical protein [Promicromonospora sp. MEB111]
MSTFAPTALPQVRHLLAPRTLATATPGRRPEAPAIAREAQRREAERVARQRAQAERARDNAAARHPLALR